MKILNKKGLNVICLLVVLAGINVSFLSADEFTETPMCKCAETGDICDRGYFDRVGIVLEKSKESIKHPFASPIDEMYVRLALSFLCLELKDYSGYITQMQEVIKIVKSDVECMAEYARWLGVSLEYIYRLH